MDSDRLYLIVVLVIVAVAAALRFYQLGKVSLWWDESGQASAALMPLPLLLQQVKWHHGAAPLDYLITAITVRLSYSEMILRLPSALWGTLAVYWIYRLGRWMHSPAVGLIAAALLAMSAFHLRYSQELRFYSLLVLLELILTECLLLAYQVRNWVRWLIYSTVAVATLYAHYYGLLVIAFHGVWVIAKSWSDGLFGRNLDVKRQPLVGFLLASGLAVLAFTPWMIWDLPRESGLPHTVAEVLPATLMSQVGTAFGGQSPTWWPLWMIAALLGMVGWFRRDKAGFVLLTLWAAGSLPLIVLIDSTGSYFFHVRQMLFALPAFLLLVAGGIALLASAASRFLGDRIAYGFWCVAIGLLLVVTAFPQVLSYYETQGRSERWREIASFLSTNLAPGDVPVSYGSDEGLAFYAPDVAARSVDVYSLSEVEKLYSEGTPLWIVGPIAWVSSAERESLEHWLSEKQRLVFTFGDWQTLSYVQDQHGVPDLWARVRRLVLPEDAAMWMTLAETLDGRDDDGAKEAYERVTAYAKDGNTRAAAWERLGDIDFRLGDYRGALEMYERRVAEKPADGELLVKEGISRSALGEYEEAERVLARAISDHGTDDYWVHRAMGGAQFNLGRSDEALRHYRRALELGPENHDLRYLAGEAALRLGDEEQARVWFEDYLTRAPEGPWAENAQTLLNTLSGS